MLVNYTLENVYNENFIEITKILGNIVPIMDLVMLFTVLYLIFFQSKQISYYRWYLMIEVLSYTVVQFIFVLTKIVILSPMPVVILTGPLEKIIGIKLKKNRRFMFLATNPGVLVTILEIALYSLMNMVVMIFVAALYRLVVLLNLTILISIFEERKYILIWVAGYQISVLGILYSTIERHRNENDYMMITREIVMENVPFLEELIEKHRIYGIFWV